MTRSHLLCGFAGLMLGFSIAIQANQHQQLQPTGFIPQHQTRFTN